MSNPARRNALFSACTLTPEERAHYLEHMGDDDGPCVHFCRALSSPAESAAIVRSLLEGCGVDLVMCLPDKRIAPVALLVVPRETACSPVFTVGLEDIPALILRLLDADSSDEHHARCSKCLQPCTFTPVFPSGFDFQCAVHGEVYPATRQQKALAALREVGR